MLKQENHYYGPIDEIYGGGTESALKAYQRSEDMLVDGIVRQQNGNNLFDEDEVPVSAIF